VRHRVYSELLRLAKAETGGGETKITPPPTQAELAARVSTRRDAVSRELKRLERAGLIVRRRGGIVILKPSELYARIEKAFHRFDPRLELWRPADTRRPAVDRQTG
jgi:CRP/FNR family cyclic AMP-dependent transcriptional regulator